MLRLLWKSIPKHKRKLLLSDLGVLQQQFYNDILNKKPLPNAFHKTKSIFVHIPKCAGVTVNQSLYGDWTGGHRTASSYQHRYPTQYKDYFTFAFVRNPWDRLVSAWKFCNTSTFTKQSDLEWQQLLTEFKSFEDFVLNWLFLENIEKHVLFVPQSKFLFDKNGIISLNHVGRQENFNDELAIIAESLDIPLTIQTKNRSRIPNDDYRHYYTTEMVDRVNTVYNTDIKLLDYHFE